MGPVHVRHRSRPTPVPTVGEGVAISNVADPKLEWVKRQNLAFEYWPTGKLRPYARNARTHSKKQLEKIAASIRQFGFVNPILVDENGEIVAGHGRLAAAILLGLDRVPVVRLDHLTDEQKRAYRIADNRIAELAGWDEPLLTIELKGLLEIETSFDIEITGFEMGHIDVLLNGDSAQESDPADDVEMLEGPVVTRLDDLWQLGPHRLLCADARDRASFATLLDDQLAQIVVTDPPFNVRIDGHVSGLGAVKHREFVMGSGEMTKSECGGSGFLDSGIS